MPRAENGMKECSKCREVKPVEQFFKNKAKKDWLNNLCRTCDRASHKAWRDANIEKVKARKRNEYWKNRKENLEKQRAWKIKHPEKVKARHKRVQLRSKAWNALVKWLKENPNVDSVPRNLILETEQDNVDQAMAEVLEAKEVVGGQPAVERPAGNQRGAG